MVSVIIPAFNSEKYLRESLDSVLQQTFKDYEIIVVDDGSTDNTREILQQEYPMVRYPFQSNQGAASARNRGIKEAKGVLIAFLDADDIWLPTKLEKQVDYFRHYLDVGLVFTENRLFNSSGIVQISLRKREKLMQGDIVRNIFWRSGVVTSTVMVRKEVFQEIGVFDERLLTAEDDNLWLRIAVKFKIDLIDEPLALYRVRDDSLSRKAENIFIGVKKHLEILNTECPELRGRLGRLIDRKHSLLHLSRGWTSFSRNDFQAARADFMKSLKYWKLNFRSLFYWGLTFLPLEVIKVLRNSKNKVLGRE